MESILGCFYDAVQATAKARLNSSLACASFRDNNNNNDDDDNDKDNDKDNDNDDDNDDDNDNDYDNNSSQHDSSHVMTKDYQQQCPQGKCAM